METFTERTIILIGKTGEGKSSAGNTILGKEVFIAKASANSVTAKSERKQGLVHGRKITVIDTPGFFDTDRDEKEIKSEIVNSLIECAPAVHAFCIVLKVQRYTSQENEVVQQFLNTMKGEHVLKHTVILFTHGEKLDDQTIENFVKGNSILQELVDKCGGRCHVFDNKDWNDCDSGYKSNSVQVKNLLDTIDKMVKENGCFTNELLQKVEEDIQEEVKKNKDNLPPEEKREKAKKIVHKKYMKQFAGLATGALIGAFLGVVVPLAAALALLAQFCPIKEIVKAKIAAIAGEAVAAGGAAIAGEAAAAGGAATAGGAAIAGEAVAAGGAATAGGAAIAGEAAAAGGAVIAGEAAAAGGAAGGAGAGAGVSTGATIAGGVLGVAALAGAIGGGVTGWKAAEEADSVYDAMTKAANANYENATVMIEKIQGLAAIALNPKNKE